MELSQSQVSPQHQTDRGHRSLAAAPTVKEVVLVDPDARQLSFVWSRLQSIAEVEIYQEFQAARERLWAKPPDLLFTNVRLGAYNGLHLVYLAQQTPTRCVVYASRNDAVLMRQVRDAGAFYESSARLPHVIESYVRAQLPARDRRDPRVPDRRQTHRGGRRCTDR